MRAVSHSIIGAALTRGGPRRHPAYVAAAPLVDLACPDYYGLYTLMQPRSPKHSGPFFDARTYRVSLGSCSRFAAAIADRAEFTEDIQGALPEVAADYRAAPVPAEPKNPA